MPDALLTHRHIQINPSYATPRPDDVDGANWLEPHIFNAPAIGSVLVGDPSSATGAGWVAPGGANLVLISQGEGSIPSWGPASEAQAHELFSPMHPDTVPTPLLQGSLIVVNSDSLWAQFAIGPAGSFLVSDGVGPVWGDTVPGLKVSGLTEGRVTFAGVGGALDDSVDLLWDDTTKLFKIGTGSSIGSDAAGLTVLTDVGIRVAIGQPIYNALGRSGLLVGTALETQSFVLEAGANPGINADLASAGFYISNNNKAFRLLDGVASFGAHQVQIINSPTPAGIADGVALAAVDLEGAGTRGFYFIDELLRVHTLGRLLGLAVGDGTVRARVGGVLSSQTGDFQNAANTTEQDAFTFTLPAGGLGTNGQRLRIRSWGTKGTGNNVTIRHRFGASICGTFSTSNIAPWSIMSDVIRTGGATQDVFHVSGRDSQSPQMEFNQLTETLSGALVVKVTVQSSVATVNQVQVKGFLVEWGPE